MKIKYFSITITKIIFIPFRAKWLVRNNSLHATSAYAQKSSEFPGTQNTSNHTFASSSPICKNQKRVVFTTERVEA